MKPLVILLALLALPAAAQSGPVLLRWKVRPDSALAFRTTMRVADEPSDSADASLLPRVEGGDLTTVLRSRPDDQLDVRVTIGAVTFADDSTTAVFDRLREEAGGALQIQARMTDAGRITSGLQQEQANMVALFFELPEAPVAVGDTWALDGVRMLAFTGGMQATDSSRTNVVRLVALEGTPEAPIAILEYDLHERLASHSAEMASDVTARGAFDVARGTWQRLDGRMGITNSMFDALSMAQTFTLEPAAAARER